MMDVEHKSTGSLLSDALTHVASLVRKEMDLARAELNASMTQAGTAIGMIVAAVIILLVALNVLTAALVDGLTELGVDGGVAALIVGLLYCVIAYGLLRKGTSDLKATNLAPRRTSENLRKDAAAVKGATHHDA